MRVKPDYQELLREIEALAAKQDVAELVNLIAAAYGALASDTQREHSHIRLLHEANGLPLKCESLH